MLHFHSWVVMILKELLHFYWCCKCKEATVAYRSDWHMSCHELVRNLLDVTWIDVYVFLNFSWSWSHVCIFFKINKDKVGMFTNSCFLFFVAYTLTQNCMFSIMASELNMEQKDKDFKRCVYIKYSWQKIVSCNTKINQVFQNNTFQYLAEIFSRNIPEKYLVHAVYQMT